MTMLTFLIQHADYTDETALIKLLCLHINLLGFLFVFEKFTEILHNSLWQKYHHLSTVCWLFSWHHTILYIIHIFEYRFLIIKYNIFLKKFGLYSHIRENAYVVTHNLWSFTLNFFSPFKKQCDHLSFDFKSRTKHSFIQIWKYCYHQRHGINTPHLGSWFF